MPKTKISEYSVTNSSNTDIEGINIDEGCAPSGINNAIRELMVHLKEFQTGASGDAFTFAGGVLISGTANTITGNVLMSGTNTITGSTTATFAAGAVGTPSIAAHGDTNTGIFFPAADTIAFAEGGAEAMRIDSSGNVGIGTSSPASKLHISGGTVNTARIDGSNNGGAWLVMRNGTVSGGIYNTGAILGDTTSGIGILAETGYDVRFYTNGSATERARITSGGNLDLQKNLGLGGTSATTSGTGITFPATQNASSDANTLDDYEEGTFTPTARGGTTIGTTTHTLQQGSYTKIGRQVTVSIRIAWSAMTGTGELWIASLPFTSTNDSMEYMGSIMTDSLNWTAGTQIAVYMGPNTNYFALFNITDDAGWGTQQCVNETASIRITVTYFV